MRDWVESIGTFAALCTTFCWLPQAIQIIREKRTEGVSLITQLFFTVGCASWCVYGLLLHEWPLIAANVVTTALSATILSLKVRYPS
jgi:MtN3 and saliva related transmembrane protein